jgi:ATP-dependent protease ClpP protease subunit
MTASLWIDGAIGPRTVAAVRGHLADRIGQPVHMVVISGGGDASAALTAVRLLRNHDGLVTAEIRYAASAGAVIATAASRRTIAADATMRLHPVRLTASGTVAEIRSAVDRAAATDAAIAELVAEASGLSAEAVRELIVSERRIPATEALTLGLVHEIGPTGFVPTMADDRLTLASRADAIDRLAARHAWIDAPPRVIEAIRGETARLRTAPPLAYKPRQAVWTCDVCRTPNSAAPTAECIRCGAK